VKRRTASTVLGLAMLSGCSFFARDSDAYRTAVRSMLDTKSPDIEGCYKRAHEANAEVKGTVVVHFFVEPKTGDITSPEVVKEQTTADEALQRCVLDSLGGLKLDPADQRKGDATFIWNFNA
jgi:hypothetical protein